MKSRGLIIWLVGMAVLGLMAAFLFSQSNKNKQELDKQAARNVLLVRENLRESLDALTIETRSFVGNRLILSTDSGKFENEKNAVKFLERDFGKFQFKVQTDFRTGNFSYKDGLVLSNINLGQILKEDFGRNNIRENLNNDSLHRWISGLEKTEWKDSLISTSISFPLWLEAGLRKSSFFDIVFLANEQGEILFPNSLIGSKIAHPGKSMRDSLLFSDVSHFKMEVSTEVYEGYISPLKIGNQILWVGGLKNQEDIGQAAYHINYNLLMFTGLLLILLLLSLPLISFFEMGKGDVVSRSKVYQIGVSLLLLFMVSGLTMSFLIFRPDPILLEEERATKVMAELKTHFEYIQNNLNQTYDPYAILNGKTLQINEEIEVCQDGFLNDLRTDLKDITVSDRDFNFINVKHRNYYKYYFTKESQKKTPKSAYFIERIFSQQSGKAELVMSTRTPDKNSLNAITFKFTDTLINTANKGYLLIKEDGEVIFSSEKFEFIFTQIKNALPEDKWENLQSLIKNNTDESGKIWKFPLHLNGKEYTALVSRFGLDGTDKPIWFIYLVNINMYHSLTGLMVIESTIWLFFYGMLLWIIYLTKLLLKKSKGYNWESFTYNTFHPKKITVENLKLGWKIFAVFSVVLSLIFLRSGIGSHLLYSALLICLLALFFAFFNRLILQRSSKFTRRISTSLYSSVLFFWFALIGFVPGFWISAGIFRYESQIWHGVQEDTIERKKDPNPTIFKSALDDETFKESKIDRYYEARADVFSYLDKGYDSQLREMIYPNFTGFRNSVSDIYRNAAKKQESSRYTIFWAPLILLFLSLAFGIFMLLRKLVRCIYWTDFDLRGENELGTFIRQKLSECKDLRLFICGCDSRKNRDWIHNYLRISLDEMEVLDCTQKSLDTPLDYLKMKGKRALLIENIHCIEDMGEFIRQFPRIQRSAAELHLIISSGVSWKNLVTKLNNDVEKVQFSELMSDFYFEIVPISFELSGVKDLLNVFNEKTLEEYFKSQGTYSRKEENPHLSLLLQRYGKAYFYNLWTELSIDEKNVCHAFSKEGFFNFKNKEEVVELFQKGIIVKDEIRGQLQLFSKTFRYFILSLTSEQMMGNIMEYRKKRGNSLNTQWALLSFLLLAFGLLSYFDQTFLTELQAIITGVAGISTLVIGEVRKFWITKSS